MFQSKFSKRIESKPLELMFLKKKVLKGYGNKKKKKIKKSYLELYN